MAGAFRQILATAVIATLGVGGWHAWTTFSEAAEPDARRERPAPGVVVEPTRIEMLERTVAAVGAGRPVRSVQLAPSTGGRVVEIGFEGGEAVKAGTVLLRLDPTNQQSTLTEAKAELRQRTADFDRQQALLKQGRVTESVFENAAAAFSIAEVEVARAQKALSDRTLTAPFDGVVAFRTADIGALMDANSSVGGLDDISSLNVDFSVPERFYGEVKLGSIIRATSEIFPGEVFTGELIGVARRIDTVSRSFTARARVVNPELRLPADVFMRVTLVLEERTGIIAPEEAISSEGGAAYIYVVADGKAERRKVTIGIRRAGIAEIAEGVEPGEMVVTRGLQKVRNGAPVRILDTTSQPDT
jgi:membrane fusion protein (multidrug efflux system)